MDQWEQSPVGTTLGTVAGQLSSRPITDQGRIQEFWKGGPGKGAKPRPERRKRERRRGASPENFEKLDAISCNLAYIFGMRMASDIIQSGAFAEQKTVVTTISIQTHTHAPPHFQKLLGFRPLKIQIQFQTYFFFRHCIQCRK